MTAAVLMMTDARQSAGLLPHNAEAEQGLLGAILLNNRWLDRVGVAIRAEMFFDPAHARIFEAVERTIAKGGTADPVTLHRLFRDDPDLGGTNYLSELVSNLVAPQAVPTYAALVRDTWQRRRIIEACRETEVDALSAVIEDNADDLLNRASTRLFDLVEGQGASGVKPIRDAVNAALAHLDEAVKNREAGGTAFGFRTGLDDLDRLIRFRRKRLVILGARPSMGKSGVAFNTFAPAIAQDAAVLVFSTEMDEIESAQRQLAAETGIPTDRQERGELSADELRHIGMAAARVSERKILIDDTASLTPMRIRQRTMQAIRRYGVGAVIVDHLQRLEDDRQHASEHAKYGTIAKLLKNMAKDLDICVILLAQLSRKIEERQNKRPLLSDLRESGRIEEEADDVLFFYREEYYLSREEPVRRSDESDRNFNDRLDVWSARLDEVRNVGEVVLAKRRGGAIGTTRVLWDGVRTQARNLYQPAR
ncbi:MAG TPA: DnaB-like helicase C-terminal domain-containing protein [Kaistia sp.]|jgi:replicative DNA helicase|nr:DnaB-like helicase C-terminal domain-containing protein [Kaistia sp.]